MRLPSCVSVIDEEDARSWPFFCHETRALGNESGGVHFNSSWYPGSTRALGGAIMKFWPSSKTQRHKREWEWVWAGRKEIKSHQREWHMFKQLAFNLLATSTVADRLLASPRGLHATQKHWNCLPKNVSYRSRLTVAVASSQCTPVCGSTCWSRSVGGSMLLEHLKLSCWFI